MSEENHYSPGYLAGLQSTAERIVGSFEDAQDIVQDTIEKWFRSDRSGIENHSSYIFRSLVNNCQSHIRSLKTKREALDRLSELISRNSPNFEMDFEFMDQDGQLKRAIAYMSKKLKPLEQGVFILREVFNLEYEVIQEVLGKKAENCRQVLSRAKAKIGDELKKGEEIAHHRSEELLNKIKEASQGRFQELFFLLNPELKKI